MQPVSSRIWTCVAMSISYDDNHYTTGTTDYIMMWILLVECNLTIHFWKHNRWSIWVYIFLETLNVHTHTYIHIYIYIYIQYWTKEKPRKQTSKILFRQLMTNNVESLKIANLQIKTELSNILNDCLQWSSHDFCQLIVESMTRY